jgi:hypothetical protein
MSKFSTIKVVNGQFAINTETSDLQSAIIQFHSLAQTLWNAPDVATAKIAIMDEQLNVVDGYAEFIHHEVSAE